MSRQPANLDQAANRQAIWDALRRLARAANTITARSIRGELRGRLALDRINTYLRSLSAAGYLEAADPDQTKGAWTLVRDCGVEAPRVRRDGSIVTAGQGQRAMWTVLRILPQPLTPVELAAHACSADDPDHPVTTATAASYLLWLHRAGYLRRVGSAADGYRYQLIPIRNTGPQAPQIQRVKQVYDPNTACVVYSAHARAAETVTHG